MASIPIENETPYTLTDAMRQDILHDAHEHFGDEVRSIRVQEGLERHAFNARTHQVRYAFSPTDFGLVRLITSAPATADTRAALPRQEGRRDEEAPGPSATLLEHLEGRDGAEQDDDVFALDDPVEAGDEDDEGDEEDEDEE
jgi:hypothetical protein